MEENKEYTMSKTGIRETDAEPANGGAEKEPASDTDREPFVSSHTRAQRVLAWVAIGMLLALTVTDLTLALIGTETAQNALKVMIVLTILVPIILYFFVLMLKKRKPDNTKK